MSYVMDDLDVILSDFQQNLLTSTPEPAGRTRSLSIISRLQSSTCTTDSGIGSQPSTQERSAVSSWNNSEIVIGNLRQNLDITFADEEENNELDPSCDDDILSSASSPEWHLSPVDDVSVSITNFVDNSHFVRHFAAGEAMKRSSKLDYIETVRQCVLDMTTEYLRAPMSCLIGVNCGMEFVDILSELCTRNQYVPLKRILSLVDDFDLCSVSAVCSTWKTVVSVDSASRERKLRFLSQRAPLQKENCVPAKKAVVRQATVVEPLSAIHNVIHNSTSQPLTTLTANTFPFQLAMAEHESLRRCPNCAHPARVNSLYPRGTCTNPRCAFDYCTDCHAPYVASHHCHRRLIGDASSNPAPLLSTSSTVGAKRSRNNLRRL